MIGYFHLYTKKTCEICDQNGIEMFTNAIDHYFNPRKVSSTLRHPFLASFFQFPNVTLISSYCTQKKDVTLLAKHEM